MTSPALTKFYVYEHWRTDKNVPFYVGKGYGNRAKNLDVRGNAHKAIREELAALGLEIEIRFVSENMIEKDAFALEKEKIADWRAKGMPLVNLCSGGQGCSGYKHTPEAISKTVAFHTGKKRSAETRKKISDQVRSREVNHAVIEMLASINRGKKRTFTEEHKAKIGVASKGRKMPSHVMEALKQSRKPRIQTQATKDKISVSNKGRKHPPISDAHKAAISAASKGRKFSSEVRAKMAAAAKLREQSKRERIGQ